MEGSSPLVCTMLYPPVEVAWLQTYAWNGHLENFMLWNNGHTDHANIRPPLISYAKWNIWQGPDLPWPPDWSDSSLGPSSASTAQNKSGLTPPTHLYTPPSFTKRVISTLMVVMVYLFLDQQSNNSRLVALPLIKFLAGSQYQYHQCQSCQTQSPKSWKSCSC